MKFLVMVLLLAGTSTLCAQPLLRNFALETSGNFSAPVQFHGHASNRLPQKFNNPLPGERMRNTGRTLTILGSALFIGGIVVVSGADSPGYSKTYTSSGTYEEGDPQGALGVVMITGGAGMAIPGIIFWSKGSKKYKAALREAAPAAYVQPGFNGMAIRLRF